MGKQAKGMKRERGRGGWDERGPWLMVKRRSLKVESHEMKKEVMPEKCMEVKLRGRRRKRIMIGEIEMILGVPVGKIWATLWV